MVMVTLLVVVGASKVGRTEPSILDPHQGSLDLFMIPSNQ
jgi:hypothetical protein